MAGGRPSEYKPEYAQEVTKLAEAGLTDAEIAEEFGVSRQTIWRWKSEHPEFGYTLKAAKGIADDRVEAALFKRAVGFEHAAVKVGFDKDGQALYAPYVEYVVPDTTAQIFWLKNRRKDEWRDKSELEIKDSLAERLAAARKRKA